MIALAAAFLATALIYAIAGFGGGSTYTALLVLAGTDFRAVPILSLACNIIVVSAGTWRFARAGHFDWRRAWPLFVTSVPAAWIGGRLMIERELFIALLAGSLLVAALVMLWEPKWKREIAPGPGPRWVEPIAGGSLGLLAGIVGIGGGIFLAPLLYLHEVGCAAADRGDLRGVHPGQFDRRAGGTGEQGDGGDRGGAR